MTCRIYLWIYIECISAQRTPVQFPLFHNYVQYTSRSRNSKENCCRNFLHWYCGAEFGKSNFGFVSKFCPTTTGKGYSVPVFLLTPETQIYIVVTVKIFRQKIFLELIELIVALEFRIF